MPHPHEPIRSASNPLLKDVRRAVARGRLTRGGLWVAEGPHLLEEALRSPAKVEAVLVSAAGATPLPEEAAAAKFRLRLVEGRLFEQIAATETTQGLISLVRPPQWPPQELFQKGRVVVALSGLQDPGNAGAIARAAEAFGAGGIIFLHGSANPFHPKTLRASAGSLFRLPFVHGWTAATLQSEAAQAGRKLRAADPRAALAADSAGWRRPCVLVIGSEAHGVEDELRAKCEGVRIPTEGVESLNAAAAAAILLYEAARARAGAAR